MLLPSEQRILVVTNYIRTRSFKEVHQLFEQRFRDRISPTEMAIWKYVKKYKTEGSSPIWGTCASKGYIRYLRGYMKAFRYY